MADYNILFQGQNPGTAFANAFQQAQERKQQNALMQQQMQEHEQDRQFKMQQAQAANVQQQIEAHRENIIKGAQIIRQLKPTDDASWQHALAIAQQAGIDISEVPQHFDPQYVQGISAIADTFDPQRATAMQQNFEFLKGQDPNLANSYLHNQAEGAPLIANNGDGTFTIIPRNTIAGQGGGQLPRVTDQSSYDAVPPGAKYMTPDGHVRVKQGGPTGAPSGGFPGSN